MEQFINAVVKDPSEFIPFFVMTLGFTIAVIWLLLATIDSIVKTRSTERSRRELAAYVAEGSVTPDQAEQLLAISPSSSKTA